MRRSRGLMFAGGTVLAAFPGLAWAHDEYSPPPSAFSTFVDYNGISLAAVLVAAATGLLAGARGKPHLRWAALGITGGWAIGGELLAELPAAWKVSLGSGVGSGIAAGTSLMIMGVLIALDRQGPKAIVTLLALVTGLVHGAINANAILEAQPARIACIAAAAGVLTIGSGSLSLLASGSAGRIVLRVAGSWLAAIGLLMLGWALRPHGAG